MTSTWWLLLLNRSLLLIFSGIGNLVPTEGVGGCGVDVGTGSRERGGDRGREYRSHHVSSNLGLSTYQDRQLVLKLSHTFLGLRLGV